MDLVFEDVTRRRTLLQVLDVVTPAGKKVPFGYNTTTTPIASRGYARSAHVNGPCRE